MIRSRAYLWFGLLGVLLLAPASRRGLAFDNPGTPSSPWQTQNLSTGRTSVF